MTLPALRGHDDVRRALAASHIGRSLPPTLLLHGPPGVGKQTLALWLGRTVLCERPGPEGACESCLSCRLALRLEHPDLHWYFPLPRPKGASSPERLAAALESARFARLDEIRQDPLRPVGSGEAVTGLYLAAMRDLRRRAHRKPATGDRQVFVIADSESLVPQESSPEAANALLKVLEEPPEASLFILTASEPGRLLDTIRSRSLPIHLSRLPRAVVESFLIEEAGAAQTDAERAAHLGQGSIGVALGYLSLDGEAGALEDIREQAWELLQAAVGPEPGAAYATGLAFRPAGARGLTDLLEALETWLRDLAAVATGSPNSVVNADRTGDLSTLRGRSDVRAEDLAKAVGHVEEARFLAEANVNPQLLIAGLLTELRDDLTRGGVPRCRDPDSLTHLDEEGRARMVDVTTKDSTHRVAVAEGRIRMARPAFDQLVAGNLEKGDPVQIARIAGIMAGKKTGDLIPLCHLLPEASIEIDVVPDSELPGVRVTARARICGRTGVEMEALTAVSVALLTVYDMVKAVDRTMVLGGIRLREKRGGASGDWERRDPESP